MLYKDLDEFRGNLKFIAESKVGDQAKEICEYIDIACDVIKPVMSLFMDEYAARSVHDAVPGGLADHTAKVFHELINMLWGEDADESFYVNIKNNVDLKALIVGCILHDIGKVFEYDKGENRAFHWVSHPIHGVAYLATRGLEFTLGTSTYFRVLSIIGQHHGEFGEKPQTIEAYLVHLADYQESRLQILEEAVRDGRNETPLSDFTIQSKYLPFKMNVEAKSHGL